MKLLMNKCNVCIILLEFLKQTSRSYSSCILIAGFHRLVKLITKYQPMKETCFKDIIVAHPKVVKIRNYN